MIASAAAAVAGLPWPTLAATAVAGIPAPEIDPEICCAVRPAAASAGSMAAGTDTRIVGIAMVPAS